MGFGVFYLDPNVRVNLPCPSMSSSMSSSMVEGQQEFPLLTIGFEITQVFLLSIIELGGTSNLPHPYFLK
jgi:hypothetical protein